MPNRRSEALAVPGDGDMETGSSKGTLHFDCSGSFASSTISKSSGKSDCFILVRDFLEILLGLVLIYRCPYSIFSPRVYFFRSACSRVALIEQSGMAGGGCEGIISGTCAEELNIGTAGGALVFSKWVVIWETLSVVGRNVKMKKTRQKVVSPKMRKKGLRGL